MTNSLLPYMLAQSGLDGGAIVAIGLGLIAVILISCAVLYARMLKKVRKGFAGVRTGMGGTEVAFDKLLVIPIVQIYEEMDISVKRIEIDRRGQNGLICKDNVRADINVVFFVRINNCSMNSI